MEVEKYLESYEFGFCGKLDCILKCRLVEIGVILFFKIFLKKIIETKDGYNYSAWVENR